MGQASAADSTRGATPAPRASLGTTPIYYDCDKKTALPHDVSFYISCYCINYILELQLVQRYRTALQTPDGDRRRPLDTIYCCQRVT